MSLNNLENSKINNNSIKTCTEGFNIGNNTNVVFDNNLIEDVTTTAIAINKNCENIIISKNDIDGFGGYGIFVNNQVVNKKMEFSENKIYQKESGTGRRSIVLYGDGDYKIVDNIINRSIQFMDGSRKTYIRTKKYECDGEIMIYINDVNECQIEYVE